MTRSDVLDLFNDCIFDGELNTENFSANILHWLPSDFEYDYDYGASKLVLLPFDEKFVIKIPFDGDLKEADSDYYDDYIFVENENACNDYRFNWDYCAAETLLYRCAKSRHVNWVFCNVRCVGFVEGHPIYIQERVLPYSQVHSYDFSYSDERSSKAREISWKEKVPPFSATWQTDALEYYGEKKFSEIMKFLYDYNIWDLHHNNIGYLGDKPVIFDYGCWAD